MPGARLTACVMLPFAAGYFLSYLFRTVNAVIANDLVADLNLGAADLGFLTSIYFLVLAAVQLPFGALLDRHGPKIIQSALLLLASMGALVFALADGLAGLVIGRALLALGVALALMAGFKAIVVWFPPGRVGIANGWLVMLGALGAVTATAPAEMVVQTIGWRGLFAALAGLSALAALLVLLAVPDRGPANAGGYAARAESLWAAYRDRRFWRIAPLSAVGIGTSWSLQCLWAAPWLRDVDGLDRTGIVQHLTAMAIAVCVGALLFGAMADRLRRVDFKMERVLAATIALSMAAQTALVLACTIPSLVLWSIIAAAGAATVLSFAILASYFPKEVSGRANAALNLLHVSAAFLLQSGSGIVIAQWPEANGGYALEAHHAAMTAGICAQFVALAWFALPRPGFAALRTPRVHFLATRRHHATARVHHPWRQRKSLDGQHLASWRFAAAIGAILCAGLSTALWETVNAPVVAIHVAADPPFTGITIASPGFLALRDDNPLPVGWGEAAVQRIGWQRDAVQPTGTTMAIGRNP